MDEEKMCQRLRGGEYLELFKRWHNPKVLLKVWTWFVTPDFAARQGGGALAISVFPPANSGKKEKQRCFSPSGFTFWLLRAVSSDSSSEVVPLYFCVLGRFVFCRHCWTTEREKVERKSQTSIVKFYALHIIAQHCFASLAFNKQTQKKLRDHFCQFSANKCK